MDYGQRLTTILFILVAIVMLCGGAAYIGYAYGQDKGYYSGHQAGQKASYEEGLDKGKQEGYQVGYNTGYESGLRESSGGYDLRNPTYKEMKEFLAQDTTDSKTFVEDKYVCTDFSAEVNNKAEAQGIRCAIVYIIYPKAGHTIVAFETRDKGLKFIEPQFDDEVSLIAGKSYSQINGYASQPEDDTIKRFLIIW